MDSANKFIKFLDQRVAEFGAQYRIFGIFALINYPLSYFILVYLGDQTNESAIFRLIASMLSVPLIFTELWPLKIKKYLNLYWFLTLMYCLPIMGVYMLLQNNMSIEWLMNISLGLFLLILLVDWVTFSIIYSLGMLLGCLLFKFHSETTISQINLADISLASYIYAYAIIIGIVFSRNHELMHKEKLNTMKTLAGTIAHELRTPLTAIMLGAQALGKLLPYYQTAYAKAKAANLLDQELDYDQEKYLANFPKSMKTVSSNAHTMITMLLSNLKEGTTIQSNEACSMRECVEEALKTYPFTNREQAILQWKEDTTDFSFLGHKEFTKQVLFNLLKNSLYAIASVSKGEIFITLEQAEKNSKNKNTNRNRLIFKDTGSGIPPKNLRHIFDKFYTKKEHGTGIGLAFCQSVIKGFGGDITCTSQQGEHTTFTIYLPVLNEVRPQHSNSRRRCLTP